MCYKTVHMNIGLCSEKKIAIFKNGPAKLCVAILYALKLCM